MKKNKEELPVSPFHMMFPLTLTYQDEQKQEKVCYFQCQEHLDKYKERYKIRRSKTTKTRKR